MRLPIRIIVLLLLPAAFVVSTEAAERCASVSMTVTASFPNDPGFEGYYRYAVFGNWTIWPRALSHMDIFLMLQDCPFICTPGIIAFGDTAGISTGADANEAPCYPVFYEGEYLCMGDPSLPPDLRTSTVKFEPWTGQSCEPGTVGMGSWRFYSPLPPGPSTIHVDAVVIKHGQYVCTGDISGQLPGCSVPIEGKSWGKVKGQYR